MIAEQLFSPATQSKVRELLAKGGDLVSIASWADEVILAAHNEGQLRANQEAIEFNKNFRTAARGILSIFRLAQSDTSKPASSHHRTMSLTRFLAVLRCLSLRRRSPRSSPSFRHYGFSFISSLTSINPCTAAPDTTALMDLAPLSLSLLPHRHLESLTIGAVLWCERNGTTASKSGSD